jgi:hypothetical protein
MEKQTSVPKQDGNISEEVEDAKVVVAKQTVSEQKEQKIETEAEPAIETQASMVSKKPSFRIAKPEEQRRYIKMLIYGDFGVGKTTFSGGAQDVKEMQNVINIDAEGGDKVLAQRGDVDVARINRFRQLSDIYEFLRAHCLFRDTNNIEMLKKSEAYYRDVDPKEIKKPKIYNTVMIDSLTEVQRYCMYDLLGIDIEKTKIDYIPETPVYQDWGRNSERIRLLVRKFRDLPMHVILVCSRQYDKDELNRYMYAPQMPGKLANEIQGFMDHVGYMTMETNKETKEINRYLMLQPGITYQAKNRFSNFREVYLVNPVMRDIYDLEVLNKSVPTSKEQ